MLRANVVVVAVILGCSGNSTGPNAHGVADVSMSPDSLTIAIGDSAAIRAQPINAAGAPVPDTSLFWSTSDSTIVAVDQHGMVRATGIGSANIDASLAGVSPRRPARVVVVATPVASIVVAPTTTTLNVGGAFQFTDTTKDAAGHVLTGRTVSWSSSDTTVATVDQAGLVLGKAAGSATITASAGSASARATVSVSSVAHGSVATVIVTPDTATIANSNNDSHGKKSVQLTATLMDAQGHTIVGPPVTWSSDEPDVAVVSPKGVVKASDGGSHGTATIRATSQGVQGTATVTVVDQGGG